MKTMKMKVQHQINKDKHVEFKTRDRKKNLRIISFNVNGLEKGFTDVQHYMLRERADIVCIQEARIDTSFSPR